ncbi:hypothetical protein GF395_04220 [Candidatus Uhrbacteria bacterium]|nr:hypothetical protein [Candidatus Uhrbacteria bacterium]
MALEIGKLKNENGKWLIEYLDGYIIELELQQDGTTIFLRDDTLWKEVYCGPVEEFHGEIDGQGYQGTVVSLRCGNEKTGKVLPVPGATPGKWVACDWFEDDVYWELQSGMLVRTPQSAGDYATGTFALEPRGNVVCTIHHNKISGQSNLGKVAFDLSQMPFPKAMCFFDGQSFQESELNLNLSPEDMDLTKKMLGELGMETIFWLL